MAIALNITLVELFQHLPANVDEARSGVSQAIRNATLEPELIERVRRRSAGIYNCRY
jgi:hypothetical protein